MRGKGTEKEDENLVGGITVPLLETARFLQKKKGRRGEGDGKGKNIILLTEPSKKKILKKKILKKKKKK